MLNTGRSDLRFFAQKCLQTCLEVRPSGSCKRGAFFFPLPLGKCLNFFEKNEGLSLVDTSFALGDSPRPSKIIMAMPPYSTAHEGQYDTKYSLFDYTLRAAFVGKRI